MWHSGYNMLMSINTLYEALTFNISQQPLVAAINTPLKLKRCASLESQDLEKIIL